MEPYLRDPDFTLYVGDVREVLESLPDESVDCVVTSPPYWGLRDYGTGQWEGGNPDCDHEANAPKIRPATTFNADFNERWGQGSGDRKQEHLSKGGITGHECVCGAVKNDLQLGLEPTPEAYVEAMVGVFREVRRVLAPHGTCWLNLGDSYNAYNGNRGLSGSTLEGTDRPEARPQLPNGHGLTAGGLKPKDMVGVPWRVAFALQADGWYLRSEIVWAKLNPMPESVTDRPTKAHEIVFLLSKASWTGSGKGQYADISDEDARWLALLFDTEGNVSIRRSERKGNTQYGAQIAFANCSRPLLERAQGIVGAGQILARAGKNAPVFYWQMTSREARDLLYRIYPHLIVKQRQARVAIHMQDVVAAPNKKRPGGRRTDGHAAFLERCWQTVKVLNRFGNPDLSWVPEPSYGKWGRSEYFFDQEAVREKYEYGENGDHPRSQDSRYHAPGQPEHTGLRREGLAKGPDGRRKTAVKGADGSIQHRDGERWPSGGRNIRSVWSIATQPYPGAHFAVFPEALVDRCIRAGTSERGHCPQCRAPWQRATAVTYDAKGRTKNGPRSLARRHETPGFSQRLEKSVSTTGWRPTCSHYDDRYERDFQKPRGRWQILTWPERVRQRPVPERFAWPTTPAVVLDPFMGSGTSALVARRLGRHAVGIELNADYAEQCAKRLQQLSLFAQESV